MTDRPLAGWDLIGRRWTLAILCALLEGPHRFTDLRRALPRVSPDVLSQRLRELEEAGAVRRRYLAPPAASHIYELTDWGKQFKAAGTELLRWLHLPCRHG
jgi:DNA-binding HxlR family transcriptional regulator